ncbi:G-type lectin S-receptor-like serine/threonine-protein kinase At4g03230 [Rhododendron vialii]|uniref:G-type lectin S-receptor-like serine/threonine-protein kinase At4g03230 n=1 Tax=Rhododendron vialii TaxID=182163 RepID=UPI00265ECA25|nr:G-type lectin S-receptor-like serine/threonine-protein kinase At4g03230 [Rhododendron vialii]
MWYLHKRAPRNKEWMGEEKELQSLLASARNANDPNLLAFTLTDLVEATNNFSFENKLGEDGYGPVYKGVLHYGQEIAVKRLSRTSTQGFEEFKNKVMLTAKLYGYVPPKYVKRGIYSIKSDIYRFQVLLLQIISGNQNNCLHDLHEDLNLLDYAYDLWKCGKGMGFMDPSLDDTNSSCKLVRCMQIALLCVQENPVDRPSMLELSSMLNIETAAMNTPKRPAFSTRRDEDKV